MPGQRRNRQEGAFPGTGNANIMRSEHRHQLGPWLG
jgi:hypothetical protein